MFTTGNVVCLCGCVFFFSFEKVHLLFQLVSLLCSFAHTTAEATSFWEVNLVRPARDMRPVPKCKRTNEACPSLTCVYVFLVNLFANCIVDEVIGGGLNAYAPCFVPALPK